MIILGERSPQSFVERFRYPLIIGLLLSSLIFMVQAGTSSSTPPDGGLPELTQIQNGTATVTISSGTVLGSVTITYPTPYTPIVPKLTVTPNFVPIASNIVFLTNPTAFFQSGTTPATVWTNMPAVDTEIYGDANGEHRIEINLQNMASFRFGVNCVAPSNTPGAYLTIEYDNAGVWTELNSAQRFLIDGTGTGCPNGFGGADNGHYASQSYSALPSGAKITTATLRVDGVGGGGLGDTPSFSSLWMDWSTSATGVTSQTIPLVPTWRVCATLAQCGTTPPITTTPTSFMIIVQYGAVLTATQTAKFTWSAGVIA